MEYHSVEVNGQEIELTIKEFDILALLIMNPKRVFTYEMSMDIVWHLKLRVVENEDDEYAGCMVLTDQKTIAFKVDYMSDLVKAMEAE